MAPQPIETKNVIDVFQKGLRRGAAKLPFAPHKRYFYVEHPTEGWRVYLRSVCFLHELGDDPFLAERFLVVKRTGGDAAKATWEPPKGQMEGRDAPRGIKRSILQLLKENVRREVEEEAKVERIRELKHTGLVLQSVEPDFPPNTYFQYHVFQGQAHPKEILKARQEFEWYVEHPKEFGALRADQREKDAIDWYGADRTKIMGRWSPTLVRLYLERFKGEGST
jgi:8-oxo-dGTP pyrophosphatase MutT (NUDIX family)